MANDNDRASPYRESERYEEHGWSPIGKTLALVHFLKNPGSHYEKWGFDSYSKATPWFGLAHLYCFRFI
jgi:hypothetical protein